MDSLPFSARSQPHATLVKFGFPDTCLHLGKHWAVLVRPAQPTLGSLVLCATSDHRSYGALPPEAFAEQGLLVERIERCLSRVSAYAKINYLMLMMVDPHVHFHVIPRYEGLRTYEGVDYPDSGWPGPPDLAHSQAAGPALVDRLRTVWIHNG